MVLKLRHDSVDQSVAQTKQREPQELKGHAGKDDDTMATPGCSDS